MSPRRIEAFKIIVLTIFHPYLNVVRLLCLTLNELWL